MKEFLKNYLRIGRNQKDVQIKALLLASKLYDSLIETEELLRDLKCRSQTNENDYHLKDEHKHIWPDWFTEFFYSSQKENERLVKHLVKHRGIIHDFFDYLINNLKNS